MAELTVQSIAKAGVSGVVAALAAANVAGDSVKQASGLLIVMDNADSGPHTLTVARPSATVNCGNVGLAALSDIALVVAAGEIGFVNIPSGYVDAAGDLSWTYDAITSVSIGVFSLKA
jgi:hypothetical protein